MVKHTQASIPEGSNHVVPEGVVALRTSPTKVQFPFNASTISYGSQHVCQLAVSILAEYGTGFQPPASCFMYQALLGGYAGTLVTHSFKTGKTDLYCHHWYRRERTVLRFLTCSVLTCSATLQLSLQGHRIIPPSLIQLRLPLHTN